MKKIHKTRLLTLAKRLRFEAEMMEWLTEQEELHISTDFKIRALSRLLSPIEVVKRWDEYEKKREKLKKKLGYRRNR